MQQFLFAPSAISIFERNATNPEQLVRLARPHSFIRVIHQAVSRLRLIESDDEAVTLAAQLRHPLQLFGRRFSSV